MAGELFHFAAVILADPFFGVLGRDSAGRILENPRSVRNWIFVLLATGLLGSALYFLRPAVGALESMAEPIGEPRMLRFSGIGETPCEMDASETFRRAKTEYIEFGTLGNYMTSDGRLEKFVPNLEAESARAEMIENRESLYMLSTTLRVCLIGYVVSFTLFAANRLRNARGAT